MSYTKLKKKKKIRPCDLNYVSHGICCMYWYLYKLCKCSCKHFYGSYTYGVIFIT